LVYGRVAVGFRAEAPQRLPAADVVKQTDRAIGRVAFRETPLIIN
jgi:hypothetical protein